MAGKPEFSTVIQQFLSAASGPVETVSPAHNLEKPMGLDLRR
ncbi:MAG TPA: hypothetical protein PK513_01730 [Alphaproteobacteria bacterium]|nr:hypothetical protein [Alphaproteobacteria bacterium]